MFSLVDMGYWFIDHFGYENKANKVNPMLVSFRYYTDKKGGSKNAVIYLNRPITIPSKFFYERKDLEKIVDKVTSDDDLKNFSLDLYVSRKHQDMCDRFAEKNVNIEIIDDDKSVVNIKIPFYKPYIDKLSAKFQKGSYDKIARFQLDWRDRKVKLNGLEEVFEIKEKIDGLQDELQYQIKNYTNNKTKSTRLLNKINLLFNEIKDEKIDSLVKIKKEADKLARKAEGLLKGIDDNYHIEFDKENNRYNIVLDNAKNYISGVEFLDRLNVDEFREQVSCIIDIEKPLFKERDEKPKIKEIKNLLKKENKTKEDEERIKKLDKELTVNVDGIEAKLYEERYDSRVSVVSLMFKLEDNSIEKEVHTLYDPRLDEVNGFKVFIYKNEHDLVEAVLNSYKEKKVYIMVGHNNPYDITQLREAARVTKVGKFDIGIKGKNPKRDFVRDFMQRLMMMNINNVDTLRTAIKNYPWLRSKMPKGSFKLEDVHNYLFPEKRFKKIETYEDLRKEEIRAINGDLEAIRKRLIYATSDIEPVRDIYDVKSHLDMDVYIKNKIVPFASLTEVNFSPKIVTRLIEKDHFDRYHNLLYFGYDRKIREDELQIFKKRFSTWKKKRLEDVGINTIPIHGKYENVYQLYIPLEEHLGELVTAKYPQWKDFDSLIKGLNHVQQIGALQPKKEFFKEQFADYYLYRREQDLVEEHLKEANLLDGDFKDLCLRLDEIVEREDIRSYYKAYNNMKNLYRSVYVDLSEKDRKEIRVKKKYGKKGQLSFFSVDFFSEDNEDLIKLRDLSKSVEDRLDEEGKDNLSRFRSLFKTFDELESKIEERVKGKINGKVSDKNLIYLNNQQRRSYYMYKKFIEKTSVHPEHVRRRLNDVYKNLAQELKDRKLNVIMQKGDYLFVIGKNTDFSSSMFKLVRKIDKFEVGRVKDEEDDIDELFRLYNTEKN